MGSQVHFECSVSFTTILGGTCSWARRFQMCILSCPDPAMRHEEREQGYFVIPHEGRVPHAGRRSATGLMTASWSPRPLR
jgi:hypothetical protein